MVGWVAARAVAGRRGVREGKVEEVAKAAAVTQAVAKVVVARAAAKEVVEVPRAAVARGAARGAEVRAVAAVAEQGVATAVTAVERALGWFPGQRTISVQHPLRTESVPRLQRW